MRNIAKDHKEHKLVGDTCMETIKITQKRVGVYCAHTINCNGSHPMLITLLMVVAACQ